MPFQLHYLARERLPSEGIASAFVNLMNDIIVLVTQESLFARTHTPTTSHTVSVVHGYPSPTPHSPCSDWKLESRNLGLNLSHQLLV